MPYACNPSTPGTLDSQDLVQVTVEGISDGQAINNVYYCANPSGVGPSLTGAAAVGELALLCDAFHAWYGGWLTLLSDQLTITREVAKKVLTHTVAAGKGKFSFDIQALTSDSVTGTASGDASPTFVTSTVGLVCADAGRHYRGSKRFSPLAEAATDENSLTSTALANWTARCNAALADFTTAVTSAGCGIPWKLVVAAVSKTPIALNQTEVSPVITLVANVILGSQVSRKRKRHAA